MQRFTSFVLKYIIVITLVFMISSCELRDDGAMNFNGETVKMIYFETDKDLNKIKDKVIKSFGQPIFLDNFQNQFLYENLKFYEFNNIKMKIIFTTTCEEYLNADGKIERKVTGQSVSFALIDKENKDLLRKNSDSKKIIMKHIKDFTTEFR